MAYKQLLLLWCVLCGLSGVVSVFTPVVEVSEGRLRGLRSISGQNRYYGITYAVSSRFQPPKEPPKWDGVFDAVRRFGHCAQAVTSFIRLGYEQCLELDVYAPEKAQPGQKLPVLVFLHGGAYYYGTKAHYDPEFLVAKNVIVAIVNYRVGALGFLCINGVANLGLKDQVAALKWISKNIAAFGGDPDNVTLSGQSAGASSAAMHLLSKSSEGLFHKVILMSGNAISPWAYNLEPYRPAFKDASKLRTVTNELDVFNVFANSSVEEVLGISSDVSWNTRYFKYSPCLDLNNTDPFFDDTPYNSIISGRFRKVPMIVGFTSVEGMLFYGINNDESFKDWNENFTERLPSVFSWLPKKERRKLANKMRAHYFGKKRIDYNAVKGVVDFYSDWIAYASTDAFAKLISSHSDQPVYMYMFDYEGDRNFAKFVFGSRTGLKGASHSDDIFYIFKPAGISFLLSKQDRICIDRVTTMFTNFMKYGDPTPPHSNLVRWPRAYQENSTQSRLLRFGKSLQVIDTPYSHRGQFMLNTLCSYGQKGFVPCDTLTTRRNELSTTTRKLKVPLQPGNRIQLN